MTHPFDRPLLVYDLETTGTDTDSARIVQIAALLMYPEGREAVIADELINPGLPIPEGATEVHGISDEMVKDARSFKDIAPNIYNTLTEVGPILCGYNNRRFDDKILERELKEAGWPIKLDEWPCLDVMKLWHWVEPRTLSGAVARWTGDLEFEQRAHDAMADIRGTASVLDNILDHWKVDDLFPLNALQINETLFPEEANRVDRDGKLIFNENGEACFAFGKLEGRTLKDAALRESGYIAWCLKKDFPDDFKDILRNALRGQYPRKPSNEVS